MCRAHASSLSRIHIWMFESREKELCAVFESPFAFLFHRPCPPFCFIGTTTFKRWELFRNVSAFKEWVCATSCAFENQKRNVHDVLEFICMRIQSLHKSLIHVLVPFFNKHVVLSKPTSSCDVASTQIMRKIQMCLSCATRVRNHPSDSDMWRGGL